MIKSEMKMKYNPQIHHRRSIRLKGYDYSQAGLYFITICTQNRACLFGDVRRGESMGEGSPNQHSPVMVLNDAGKMIKHWYDELGHKFTDIKCHAMIIMPNHIHFIIENTGFTASSESFSGSSAAVVRANLCVRPDGNRPDGNRPNGNLADILPNGNLLRDKNISCNGNILGNGDAQCNGNLSCKNDILGESSAVRANLCVRPDENFTDVRPNENPADIRSNENLLRDKNASCNGNILENGDAQCNGEFLKNGNISCNEDFLKDENLSCNGDFLKDENLSCNGEFLKNGNISCNEEFLKDENLSCNGDAQCNGNILCKNDILENQNIGGEQNQNILGEHIGSPLRDVIRWFKTMTTNNYIRGVKQNGWMPFDGKLWQRNYYEHIIRDDLSYRNISDYIHNNPAKWNIDKLIVKLNI